MMELETPEIGMYQFGIFKKSNNFIFLDEGKLDLSTIPLKQRIENKVNIFITKRKWK